VSESLIEDYLDDLLRKMRTDARTTRRLLAEAIDHLYATATALREQGLPQAQAEAETVLRFGPIAPSCEQRRVGRWSTWSSRPRAGPCFLALAG
jgi:hypothetical protein